jgi:hypothetical protein
VKEESVREGRGRETEDVAVVFKLDQLNEYGSTTHLRKEYD